MWLCKHITQFSTNQLQGEGKKIREEIQKLRRSLREMPIKCKLDFVRILNGKKPYTKIQMKGK
jgi:hypothetical protein